MLELIQGRIVVNDIHHIIESENFHVFEIDLKSKYPGGVDWEYDEDNIKVFIDVNPERTLKIDATNPEITHVIFRASEYGWSAMSEASRYTWRIVLWKRPTDAE